MEMPKIIYTVASGSSLGGGHTTTVHLDLGDLTIEVNTLLIEDEFFMNQIRDQWNENATEFNKNRPDTSKDIPLKGDSDEVEFEEFATLFPNEIGWGWDNGRDEETGEVKYINITVHPWTGKRYDTLG